MLLQNEGYELASLQYSKGWLISNSEQQQLLTTTSVVWVSSRLGFKCHNQIGRKTTFHALVLM